MTDGSFARWMLCVALPLYAAGLCIGSGSRPWLDVLGGVNLGIAGVFAAAFLSREVPWRRR